MLGLSYRDYYGQVGFPKWALVIANLMLLANVRGFDCTYLLKNKEILLMFGATASLIVAVVSLIKSGSCDFLQ